MQNWFHLPEPKIQWLIDGLVPADGQVAIVGKPRAGKSTFIRNLAAAVVKGRKFLGRSVDLPENTGKVLYVHLDRKDQPWRVAKELRDLGISQKEAERLVLRTAADLTAATFEDRLAWLGKQVTEVKPNLIIIDLLWQFVVVQSSNDYNAVLDGINRLQDALRTSGYHGALVVAIHGRKAVSAVDMFDDVLGSTGQRGSFGTIIMLTHRRNEGVFTVATDQAVRDDHFGEIDETAILRNPDGTLQLGQPMSALVQQEKKNRFEDDLKRLVLFVEDHPGAEMESLMHGLSMSKKHALQILAAANAFVRRGGSGIKGDPFTYSPIGGGMAQ